MIAATLRGNAYDPAKGTVEQWISGIARNCVRRYLRAGADEFLSPDADVSVESVPAPDDAGMRDRHEALLRGLRLLTRAERTIVIRHIVDGRTFREIAAETGVPFTTVHARYTAAEARLRRILREK